MTPGEGTAPREGPGRSRRGRRGGNGPWPLLAGGLLLLGTVIMAAVILLWRIPGESVSAASLARDSVETGREPQVRLISGSGQVRVTGEENLHAVEYEATRHAVASSRPAARERSSRISVDLSRDGSEIVMRTDGGRNTGADYEVRVPADASVEVEAEAGDVEVSGVSGDVYVAAGAGDVAVRETGGSVSIEAPRGDVEIAEVGTDTGQVEAEVGAGDLELRDLVVGTLKASVEVGDAIISGRFSGSGGISVGTGDVIVQVPPEDTRGLELDAGIGSVERVGEGRRD